jgi:hypothetical protein
MAVFRSAGSTHRYSRAEAAFGILRTLERAELLWADSGLHLQALVSPRMTPPVVRGAVARLVADGVVEIDRKAQRIWLSERTRRDLAAGRARWAAASR